MTYAESIQFLYSLRLFGARFGLETTFRLAALAGNPQAGLRFIHVAGTNGKGSTCAILESIYRTAGLRVGLFTSPHLVSFRERIQINRRLISESEVVRLLGEIQPGMKQFPPDDHPTLFEIVTVMALKFFAEQSCDLVIWETGLGGRLDATNIVTPLVSVITNIAFDHTQWLGDTLEKIAAEKAGIIKPGVPVVTAVNELPAWAVIERIAREKEAPLTRINSPASLPPGSLSLPGEHQRMNAAVALATVAVLQKQIPVSARQIHDGLQSVNWPGRLQRVARLDGAEVLLDGAHNAAGARVLREALEKLFPARKRTLILGVLQDKNWPEICEILAPLAEKILIVLVASERAANPDELAAACRRANPAAAVSVGHSLKAALDESGPKGLTVITGSLYLVGEALELLGLSPANPGERALNEWQAGPRAV